MNEFLVVVVGIYLAGFLMSLVIMAHVSKDDPDGDMPPVAIVMMSFFWFAVLPLLGLCGIFYLLCIIPECIQNQYKRRKKCQQKKDM